MINYLIMKQRYIYSLLFGIPGIIISVFASILAGILAFAFLWAFVFGDNTWPAVAGLIITGTKAIAFLVSLTIMVVTGFFMGKKREVEHVSVNSGHVIISVAILVLFGTLMFTFQSASLSKKQNHKQCVDLCVQKGYDGNGSYLSPDNNGNTTCNCWNDAEYKYDEGEIIE